MANNVYVYILIMALVTYVIRALPLTLIQRPIQNRFIRSFLFYVPYVTLAVMTFPDILYATDSVWSGLLALCAGVGLALSGKGLLTVSVLSCAAVFLLELVL